MATGEKQKPEAKVGVLDARSVGGGVVLITERSAPDESDVEALFARVRALARPHRAVGLVVDISRTSPPRPEVRRALTRGLASVDGLRYVAFALPKDSVLRGIAPFVTAPVLRDAVSFHETVEAATAAVREAMQIP